MRTGPNPDLQQLLRSNTFVTIFDIVEHVASFLVFIPGEHDGTRHFVHCHRALSCMRLVSTLWNDACAAAWHDNKAHFFMCIAPRRHPVGLMLQRYKKAFKKFCSSDEWMPAVAVEKVGKAIAEATASSPNRHNESAGGSERRTTVSDELRSMHIELIETEYDGVVDFPVFVVLCTQSAFGPHELFAKDSPIRSHWLQQERASGSAWSFVAGSDSNPLDKFVKSTTLGRWYANRQAYKDFCATAALSSGLGGGGGGGYGTTQIDAVLAWLRTNCERGSAPEDYLAGMLEGDAARTLIAVRRDSLTGGLLFDAAELARYLAVVRLVHIKDEHSLPWDSPPLTINQAVEFMMSATQAF